jgi:hypothetical protein
VAVPSLQNAQEPLEPASQSAILLLLPVTAVDGEASGRSRMWGGRGSRGGRGGGHGGGRAGRGRGRSGGHRGGRGSAAEPPSLDISVDMSRDSSPEPSSEPSSQRQARFLPGFEFARIMFERHNLEQLRLPLKFA